MTNHVIDNTLTNLGKTVLWQYDKAVRLLSVLKHMQVLYHCAVDQFWSFWVEKVLSLDTCNAFGASLWGMILGVPRPTVKGEDGSEHPIAVSVYRKVLKGMFFLMERTSSSTDFMGYLEIIFGIDGALSLSKWTSSVSEYGWYTNIDELNGEYKSGQRYEKDDIFSYGDNNWLCLDTITSVENTSFDAIRSKVQRTQKKTTVNERSDTILLKLYDPNGIVRKIGGAPKDSLSITVTYDIGDSTITATATRKKKCGVKIIDGEDMTMTYTKSEYFSEMHRDQQALYEQYPNEFLPYPLGIKTNAPVEVWFFGDTPDEVPKGRYKKNKAYSKGDVFGYVDDRDGHGFNWECLDDISAEENTSFDAIVGKLRKTMAGEPFIATFADDDPPYIDYRVRQYPFYERYDRSISFIRKYGVDRVVLGNGVNYNPSPDVSEKYARKTILAVDKYEPFVALLNGGCYIFTSSLPLIIIEDADRANTDITYNEIVSIHFVSDRSNKDEVMEALGKMATSSTLPGERKIKTPQELQEYQETGVTYRTGMAVLVDGNMKTFKRDKRFDVKIPEDQLFYHTWKTTILGSYEDFIEYFNDKRNSIASYNKS